MIDILQAMDDPQLFGPWFNKDRRTRKNWRAWRAYLAALFGLPMSRMEQRIYRTCTQRETLPDSQFRQSFLIVGRRGGKSIIGSLVAVYLACFHDWTPYLVPGERGTIMLIACDRRQARTLKRYISSFFNNISLLKSLIVRETEECIELSNSINIEIHTCSFRSTRGYSIVAILADEIAFWRSDNSANPDKEVLNAVRPGMASIPGSMLLAFSSPHAKRGELYRAYRRYYAKDNSPVLIWQADTRTQNPTISQSFIDDAYAADESSARSEYGGLFREDLEQFVSIEKIRNCVIPKRYEIPYSPGKKFYCFVDPSGGQQDSYSAAISFRENGKDILAAVREYKSPLSPQAVTRDIANLLKSYRIKEVYGDRYGGEFPREIFRKYGITYKTSDKSKSELYASLLPKINSNQVELLDNEVLINQLHSLERKVGRGTGRDIIDHPQGSGWKDDVANAVAGALTITNKQKRIGTWGRGSTDKHNRHIDIKKTFPGVSNPNDLRWSRQ